MFISIGVVQRLPQQRTEEDCDSHAALSVVMSDGSTPNGGGGGGGAPGSTGGGSIVASASEPRGQLTLAAVSRYRI